jgi:hypothetical protein
MDAQKDFPDKEIVLKTVQGEIFHQKTDIYRGIYWYSVDRNSTLNLLPLSVEKVKEIIEANKAGKIPEAINPVIEEVKAETTYQSDFEQGNLDRFDEQKPRPFRKKKRKKKGNANPEA